MYLDDVRKAAERLSQFAATLGGVGNPYYGQTEHLPQYDESTCAEFCLLLTSTEPITAEGCRALGMESIIERDFKLGSIYAVWTPDGKYRIAIGAHWLPAGEMNMGQLAALIVALTPGNTDHAD